ncbi:MAG: amino acid permease [Clostridiales bacterium]|nr:amino acid permease [Clostridiales bacterium]
MAKTENQVKKKHKDEVQPELSRELSLFHLTMMGAGMMIGAGVFVATGISIGISGAGGILITFALNGLIAICSAMSFAELSSALPAAGGAYSYIKQSFGGIVGFLSGWMNWFALAVAGSLYAITFATYTIHLLKTWETFTFLETHLGLYEKILAVVIALLFILVNFRGVSETGNSASMIALGQTVTLGIIGVIGVAVALKDPSRLVNFEPFIGAGWSKILVTMGFTYVGFEGFEVIGHAGEEAINPKKNIPKAILYAVIIVVTTYLLVAFAAVIGAKPEGSTIMEWFSVRGATGFADAIKNLFPFGGILVTLAAIFSSTSALNATIYSSARVSFAMGRDGALPEKMSKISQKRRIPAFALFMSSIIIIFVAAALPVEDVAASADIMFLLIFLLINVSVIKIRREMGDELEYGFMMPFFPVIPIVALVAQLVLSIWLFDMSTTAWIATGFWIVSGFIIYFTYSKSRIKEEEPIPIFKERKAISDKYQIMVPIGNPHNAEVIGNYAARIAEARDGEMVFMSVVEVPDQIQLRAGKKFGVEKREMLNKLRREINSDCGINSVIRYSHHISRGIISATKEKRTDLVILGWKGYSKKRGFELGRKMDKVIERLTCDLIVIKPGKEEKADREIKSILIPSNAGLHSIMATEIAKNLMKNTNAKVTVFTVKRKSETYDRIRRRLRTVINQFDKNSARLKIVNGDDIVDEIVYEAHKHDIVILGATEEGFWQQLLLGKVSERIAEKCDNTVILTKKDLGVKSWVKRWLGKRVY